jgi:uncharacterized protein YfkK (UPF0435 family)
MLRDLELRKVRKILRLINQNVLDPTDWETYERRDLHDFLNDVLEVEEVIENGELKECIKIYEVK